MTGLRTAACSACTQNHHLLCLQRSTCADKDVFKPGKQQQRCLPGTEYDPSKANVSPPSRRRCCRVSTQSALRRLLQPGCKMLCAAGTPFQQHQSATQLHSAINALYVFFFPSHFLASSQLVKLVHKIRLVLGSALNTRGSVQSAVPSPHATCSSRLCRQSALTPPALLLRTQPVATCGDTQPATPGAQPWFCDPAMGLAHNPNAASYPNPSNAVRLHPPFTLLQDVCMSA